MTRRTTSKRSARRGTVTVALLAVSAFMLVGFAAAPAAAQDNATDGDGGVNVTLGQQLSTVIQVSSDELQTEVENVAFEASVESSENRSDTLRERSEELRERAEEIREDYEESTEEYEEGEISRSEYAQRIARLNGRATGFMKSYELYREHADNASVSDLQEAGVDEPALESAVDNLSSLEGSGPRALLERFTGQSTGEVKIETRGGLEIEVEGEEGELSRSFERSRDEDHNLTIDLSTAQAAAEEELSSPDNASWTMVEAEVDEEEGVYSFEFELDAPEGVEGEAEVSVDGSTGEVFELDEEVERDDDEGEEGERGEDDEGEGEEHEDDEEAEEEVSLNRSAAEDAALQALPAPERGSWRLQNAEVDDGAYGLEYELAEAEGLEGRATVVVDGESGEVLEVEDEVEQEEHYEKEDEDEEEDGGEDQNESGDGGEEDDGDDEEQG